MNFLTADDALALPMFRAQEDRPRRVRRRRRRHGMMHGITTYYEKGKAVYPELKSVYEKLFKGKEAEEEVLAEEPSAEPAPPPPSPGPAPGGISTGTAIALGAAALLLFGGLGR